ncbi:hypothetical protein QOZ80_7AG0565210 [Eleusine coracana subsp. coracana]|nr:hypothetical protein QOZ80_7AG0565210 [Eleusine coracana subsp. coracana]
MVDQLQSLGVAYHFEEEIKSILYISMSTQSEVADHGQLKEDLSLAALLFKVLRGNGIPAPNDMLGEFGDRNNLDIRSGNHKDMDGLLALWYDVSASATLPEYMKTMYSTILTTSGTAAGRVHEKQGYDVLPLYMNGWRELCKAFLVEARWQQQGYSPSFEEYLNNGWVTSTGPLLLLHALPTISQDQHHMLNMLSNHGTATIDYPRQVYLSSRIFRLCNDCATHKAETERGDAPSSIACYMIEMGVSEEEARAAVEDAIAEAWKELNHEVIASTGPRSMNLFSSASMANLCLNLARTIHCIYQDGDGITSPMGHMKQLVKDLLFNPIPVYPTEP